MGKVLSDRISVLGPEGAYAVLSKAQELERRGKKIIHLEIGQPDFPTPKYICSAGIQAIKVGKTKYTPPMGTYELREAIAVSVSKTHGRKISGKRVAVTPGGKAAIFASMSSLLNSGDEVVYPDPGFPSYLSLIKYLGCKGVPVPLTEKNKFSFDLDALSNAVNEKTKLVILNFPGNPTGSIIGDSTLAAIAKIIKRSDAWVLSDEIYSRIRYTDEAYRSIWSLPGMSERTLILDGFSKTYSMTGWRLGYLIIPESLSNKMDYLLTHTFGCTSGIVQFAGLSALKGSDSTVRAMVREFRKRRDFVVKGLNEIPGVSCLTPGGAFYVFPNISAFGKTSDEIADYLLNKAGVAVLSGTSFGKFGEGYVRISYASSIPILKEAIGKISQALLKLKN